MKTTTTIAALHALLGPPLGGLAMMLFSAGLDFFKPPLEGTVSNPIMSVGGIMFVVTGSYVIGTAPAFATGLLLGHKVSRSGGYGTWDTILAAVIGSVATTLLFDLTVAKGRTNWMGLHIDLGLFGIIVGAGVFAAIAVRKLLIWSEFIDRR